LSFHVFALSSADAVRTPEFVQMARGDSFGRCAAMGGLMDLSHCAGPAFAVQPARATRSQKGGAGENKKAGLPIRGVPGSRLSANPGD